MYLAIVRWDINGKLEKYQSFAQKADAEEHVKNYGGFVVVDPGGNSQFWVVDPFNKRIVVDNIAELNTAEKHRLERSIRNIEASITEKLIRSSILDLMSGSVNAKSKLLIKHNKINKKQKKQNRVTRLLKRMESEGVLGRSDNNYYIRYGGVLYNKWGFDAEKNKNLFVITQQKESETYTDAFNIVINTLEDKITVAI